MHSAQRGVQYLGFESPCSRLRVIDLSCVAAWGLFPAFRRKCITSGVPLRVARSEVKGKKGKAVELV